MSDVASGTAHQRSLDPDALAKVGNGRAKCKVLQVFGATAPGLFDAEQRNVAFADEDWAHGMICMRNDF
ncbi:hypothetical protein AA309_29785 [Microvirga vignae]|uniref:Uncharacterized protein n=1 Tax=Microvirga vignae TaxID=1225564 RepID=A0A0H1R3R5_9HYPH|nr:hypothetical protein AA309_29785 [Microvirga vignae]